jgi:hypothetical protein
MGNFQKRFICAFLALSVFYATGMRSTSAESSLPAFGRDTVLVWKSEIQDYTFRLVVRIAEFSPDRYLEWEDEKTQGTIFMPNQDIISAKGFVGSNLFQSGSDTRGKDATILWLSQRIYRELKEKKKAKCNLDGVAGLLTYQGEGTLKIEVNRDAMELPIIRVSDDRQGERWFLDMEDNPLMVKHMVRKYTQVLESITTNRPNTLRWIKGKKLANPPQ